MNISPSQPAILAAAAALSAALGALSCVEVPVYKCTSNEACVSETGDPGICEENGFCSFADESCSASGRRYPDGAGDGLASTCVEASNKCVTALSLGTGFSCALRSDGAVYCWGDNAEGQIGDGTQFQRSSPSRVKLPGPATAVSAAEGHACALLGDSTVWCWGSNEVKQLGVPDPGVLGSSTPIQVMIEAGMPPTTSAFKAQSISAGGGHTCAIDLGGQLHCWGENQAGMHGGQCGQDPKVFDDVLLPTPVASLSSTIAVSSGDEFACALKDDKSAWCWGDNENGELGDGSTTDSFVPVQVASLSSVGQLINGDEFACALKNDSSLWCWGYGGSGVLGEGDADQPKPTLVTHALEAYASGQSFHACALQKGGALLCWGANAAGQLGTGNAATTVAKPEPVKLITAATAALGDAHTCALTRDGALWCWGDNSKGQLGLGDGGPASASLPRRVSFPCP